MRNSFIFKQGAPTFYAGLVVCKSYSHSIKTRLFTFLGINPLNDLAWQIIVLALQALVYFPFVSLVSSDWKQAYNYSNIKKKGRTNYARSQCEGWACFPAFRALIATSWKERQSSFACCMSSKFVIMLGSTDGWFWMGSPLSRPAAGTNLLLTVL